MKNDLKFSKGSFLKVPTCETILDFQMQNFPSQQYQIQIIMKIRKQINLLLLFWFERFTKGNCLEKCYTLREWNT
jgi:hypothetical protein